MRIELRSFSTHNQSILSKERLENRLNLYLPQLPVLLAPVQSRSSTAGIDPPCTASPSPFQFENLDSLPSFTHFSKSFQSEFGSFESTRIEKEVPEGAECSREVSYQTAGFQGDDERTRLMARRDVGSIKRRRSSGERSEALFDTIATIQIAESLALDTLEVSKRLEKEALVDETLYFDSERPQEESEADQVDRGVGAIYRVIPEPHHLDRKAVSITKPSNRQDKADIHRSFVSSPSEYLQSGRGSWLLPINGKFEIDGASLASWSANLEASKENIGIIYWTDARLLTIWNVLKKLGVTGTLGEIIAFCFVAEEYEPRNMIKWNPTRTNITDNEPIPMPDHIRITMDCQYALLFRQVLSRIKDGKEKDNFLKTGEDGIRLAWTDHSGRVILLA